MKKIHYCIHCKAHVDPSVPSPCVNVKGHKLYSFGAIIKKRPITHPFERKITGPLPTSVDNRMIMKNGGFATFDQGNQGSCTANCGAGDKAFLEIKRGDYSQPFSRAFLYYMERVILGTVGQDSGAEMINIGQALTQYGICFDSTMPYNQYDYLTPPPTSSYSEASSWVCGTQHQLPTVADIKSACYDSSLDVMTGAPRIGFPVPESFMNAVVGGWVSVPKITEQILGGHAMLVLGYDDNLKGPDGNVGYFYILNSWGNVGDSSVIPGIFKFPYAFFTCAWVAANGGTDNWDQMNGAGPTPPPPPPPGTIVLSVAPTTIINDRSTNVIFQVVGVNSGDRVEVDVIIPSQQVIPLFSGTSNGTTIVGSASLVTTYSGSAVVQAFDHTSVPSMSSNQVPVTIVAPSVCPVGNAYAGIGNFVARRFGRKGRFHYLVVEPDEKSR